MPERQRVVAIIGAGISGLAAAFRILELSAQSDAPPLAITLLERGTHLGGALDTIRDTGLIAEAGADSFLTEKPAALALMRRLGLENDLISTRAEFRRTCVVRNGRLADIPEGFALLAPTRLGPVMRSPVFSARGKIRIALEPIIPRRKRDTDETLGAFVSRRLGREALDRLAQPLAGGIYTADPWMLSVRATMPRFVAMEREHGSLIRGLRAAARERGAVAPGISGARFSLFASMRNGMGALADTLAARIGESLRLGAAVEALERGPRGEVPPWTLRIAGGATIAADAIICAAPAHAAAPLVAPFAPELARWLARIDYASSAVVNMAFDVRDFPTPPRIAGFVVPIIERRRIIAGSFTSLKFEGRAPEGQIVVRAFLGGALQAGLVDLADAEMLEIVRGEFRALLGVEAPPRWTHIRRWPRAMPQYEVGHLQRVDEIERAAAAIPHFALAGAAYRGVGVPDCIASGERAAETIFAARAAPPACDDRN